MFDFCAVIALLLYALMAAIFQVFIGSVEIRLVWLLLHIAAAGAVLWFLLPYRLAGRIIGGVLLFCAWVLQIVFSFFVLPWSVLPLLQILAFWYPIVFFVAMVREHFGHRLFRVLTLFHSCAACIVFILLFVQDPFSLPVTGSDGVFLAAFLFGAVYPFCRLYVCRREIVSE